MSSFLFVVDTNGDVWFDLLYLAVFILGLFWLYAEGIAKKYDQLSWMLCIACAWLLFIIGTKVFTFSAAEWEAVFSNHTLTPTSRKFLLGGLVLTLSFYPLLKKILRLPPSTLDAFAVFLPLAIAIQRIGCFVAGCCHGITTGAGWGVQYKPYTLPHFHQFEAGLINQSNVYSLPVHPTQLYECVAATLIVLLLLKYRNRIKAPGNVFVSSVFLYCFFRFFIEFFRHTAAHAAGGSEVGGLKVIQWLLLLTMITLAGIFLYRELYFKPQAKGNSRVAPSVSAVTMVLLCIVFVTWSLRNWFTFTELLALNTAVIPAVIWVAFFLFKTFTIPEHRWVTLAILVMPVMLMSQTIPIQDGLPQDSVTVKTFKTAKVGFATGDYQNSHTVGTGSGCDRVSNTSYFDQEYTLASGAYAVTTQRDKSEYTYGVNAYLGNHTETRIPDPVNSYPSVVNETTIAGVNPYIQFDKSWFGMGAGLHVGNLSYTLENKDEDGNVAVPKSGSMVTHLYPQIHLRAGKKKILFADFNLANQFPTPFPGLRYTYGLGSGFGLNNGTFLKVGGNGVDMFMTGNLVLHNKVVLEPLFLWGSNAFGNESPQRQFMLGMHYRFGHKTTKVAK